MLDNKVYEDLAARCGGDICIGVKEVGAAALTDKLTAAFAEGNLKVRFSDGVENASFGIVVTGGEDAAAEEAAVNSFLNARKPCVIAFKAGALKGELESRFPVAAVSVGEGSEADDVSALLRAALFEFPVTSIDVKIPEWMSYLPADNSAIAELISKVRAQAADIHKMKDSFDGMLSGCEFWQGEPSVSINPADGKVEITVSAKDGIFFDMLSEIAGEKVDGESSLMRYVRASSAAKRSYDKIKDAFECAKINGYGIVQPDDNDMSLDKPEVVRRSGNVGIKLKATAPSYHIVKVEVTGEVSPIMGSERQSEGIVEGMMTGFETNPDGMWETNVFGKSLRGMVKEGLAGKVCGMHDETKTKMRKAMTRIVNEGRGGVICILL